MDVATAQHRFVEALVALQHDQDPRGDRAGDPLLALSLALACGRMDASNVSGGLLRPVFAALEDVVDAVRTEMSASR